MASPARLPLRAMDPDTITAAAQQMIERSNRERLAIIERLAAGQRAEDELLSQLAEVRQSRGRDWAEAQRLGWATRDLRRLKLRTPGSTHRARGSKNGTQPAGVGAASPGAAQPPSRDEQPLGERHASVPHPVGARAEVSSESAATS
jgi:hypothetical protein